MTEDKGQNHPEASWTFPDPGDVQRALFDDAADAIFVSDAQDRFLAVNPQLIELTGYSREELLTMRLADVIPPTDRVLCPISLDRDEMRQGKRVISERRIRRKDGGILWVEVHGRMLPDGTVLGILRDITEHKRTEAALRQSEERFAAVFKTSPTWLALVDLKNGKLVEVNEAWEPMMGFTREETIGRTTIELGIYDEQTWRVVLDDILAKGSVKDDEMTLRSKTGEEKVSLVTRKVVKIGDQPHLLSMGLDITERKRAETALQQANVVVKNSPVVLFKWKAARGWPVEYVSENVIQFGYTPQELLSGSTPYAAMVHPDDLERVGREIEQYAACGVDHFEQEYRIFTKDGEVRWVDDRTVIERDANNRITHYQGIIIDITKSKQAVDALREHEQWISSIFRAAPVGIGVVKNRVLLTVNDRICEMTGYVREELVGKSARMLYPTDADFEYVGAEKYRQVSEHGTGTVETRWLRKDGRIIDVLLSSTPIVPEDWNIGVTFTALDITERKRVELALQESEEKYRRLIETTDTGYVILDEQGRVLDANQEYVRLTGRLKREDVVGHNVIDWTAPHDRERNAEEVRKCVEHGSVRNLEIDYVTPDGNFTPIEVNAAVLRASGALHILSLCRDITERRRMQDALKATEYLLKKSQEVAEIGSYYLDAQTGTVVSSETLDRIFGIDADYPRDMAGWQDIVHPDSREEMLTYLNEYVIKRRHRFDKEYKIIRKNDGHVRWVYGLGELELDKNGNVSKMIGTIQDITERKRADEEKTKLQEQLAQSQKMESMGRLAGGVAHDFNNMLSAILGQTELALMRYTPSDAVFADLKVIKQSALRSADLVRQLLAFARKQAVAPKVLDLNDTISGMLKMLQRLIGEEIDFAWEPGAGLWPVKIDPSQLDQLLANLCVNARDAIAGVGKITIETENAAFDEAYCALNPGFVCGEYVMLCVSDNGAGMSKEVQDHLFEPFFTTKEGDKGTGLGLATVYGIVQQNEGFINISSEPGKGTTFKIYLPRVVGTAMERVAATIEETPKGSGETLLLVEDEEMILNVSRSLLEGLGYRVLSARTPSEAIRLAKAHAAEIRLLITDVIMPEMNGKALAELLAEIKPGLKSLFTSGYTADVIAHRGVLDEDVYFLQKPFTLRKLAVKVREALDRT